MIWTDEKVATLKRMRADGDSFGVIGKELGCSRNACIGKAAREGIPHILASRHKSLPRKAVRVTLRFVLANNEPKPRGDVAGGCRYLHGEPEWRKFCGAPRVQLESWCAFHLAKVWAKAKAA